MTYLCLMINIESAFDVYIESDKNHHHVYHSDNNITSDNNIVIIVSYTVVM